MSRVRNTGRPSFEPNVNCYEFAYAETEVLQSFFWLVYALWAGNWFHPLFCSTVIEFIHLRDLKQLVANAAIGDNKINFFKHSIKQISQLEHKLQLQIALIKQAKEAVIRKYFQ